MTPRTETARAEALERLDMLAGTWISEGRARQTATGRFFATDARSEAAWDLDGRFLRVRTRLRPPARAQGAPAGVEEEDGAGEDGAAREGSPGEASPSGSASGPAGETLPPGAGPRPGNPGTPWSPTSSGSPGGPADDRAPASPATPGAAPRSRPVASGDDPRDVEPPASLALYTWDASAGLYRTWTFRSSGEVAAGSMSYDAKTATWSLRERWYDPTTGAQGTGRGFMRFEEPGVKVVGWERESPDHPDEAFRVQGTSRRVTPAPDPAARRESARPGPAGEAAALPLSSERPDRRTPMPRGE